MSASRLEQFARCPFAQYLKYGLRAEERKTAAEKAADAGTFLHDALDAFVRAVESGPYDWNSITPEEIDSVLRVILPEILAAHNDGIFSRDPRLKESLFLRIRTVRQCAYSIVRQLKAGRFEVRQTEMSFGMDDTFDPVWLTLSDGSKVRIYGKIDRVDQTPDKKHLRIIDYKMGKNRKFDPTKLLSGESLQLPLYFAAAEQLGGDCAGLYYMPLTLDPPEEGDVSEHMLYGLTSSDSDAVDAAERFDGKSTLIHTVRFIGESDALADIADAMHESVRDAKPFLVRLQGTGQFAHGGAHTVYISVSGQLDEFYRIHQVLESSLLDRGFVRGRGKPEPHITLARAVEDTAGLKLYVPGTAFRANSIVLYESRNVRGSMVYTPIHSESF